MECLFGGAPKTAYPFDVKGGPLSGRRRGKGKECLFGGAPKTAYPFDVKGGPALRQKEGKRHGMPFRRGAQNSLSI